MQKMRKIGQMVDWFLYSQDRLCQMFDRFLPRYMRRWGYRDFVLQILPAALAPGLTVVDVGGGKRPVIGVQLKNELALRVIGLDVSADELELAPAGAYDQVEVADVCKFSPTFKADLVIALAVLEHVVDTGAALQNIAAILKPGGRALIFVPCRNSLYAQLNLAIPENFKKRLLQILFRNSCDQQGFKSYYHNCTPAACKKLADKYGLVVEEEFLYFQSAYFSIFLPLHVLYRIITLVLVKVFADEAAETFTLILRRPDA